MLKHYNLEEMAVVLAGVPVTQFIDGEAVTVEFDAEDYTWTQGTHGIVIRAKRPNNIATATLRVMQGADILDYLQSTRDLDVSVPTGLAFTFGIVDPNGRSFVSAPRASFMTPPPMSFGTEAVAREWQLKLANPVIRHGGQRFA